MKTLKNHILKIDVVMCTQRQLNKKIVIDISVKNKNLKFSNFQMAGELLHRSGALNRSGVFDHDVDSGSPTDVMVTLITLVKIG